MLRIDVERASDAEAIDCSACGAKAGERCKGSSYSGPATGVHIDRWYAYKKLKGKQDV